MFLIKLQAWRLAALLKRDPIQVFSCEYCEILNIYFEERFMYLIEPKKTNSKYPPQV